MSDESDHDILIEIRSDLRNYCISQSKLEKEVHGDDGQGGLIGRVGKLEGFQATLIGIAAAISLVVSTGGYWLWKHMGG